MTKKVDVRTTPEEEFSYIALTLGELYKIVGSHIMKKLTTIGK